MKFSIDKKVFGKFPDLIVAIPIITGFDNSKSKGEAISFMREAETKLRQDMTLQSLWNDRRVTAYLSCFTGFGADPKKFVPAHVALAARVLEGKNLPDINPMVNLYNAMSIKYLTPFGGENLDSLYGDFMLKFAKGGEQWIAIGGKESKAAVTGELVWGDDYDLSTRALNWRQCDRTKMTGTTKNGYFVMDGFSDINGENIRKAADEFIKTATKMFGGKAQIYWLKKDTPSFVIAFSSRKKDTDNIKNQSVFQDRKAIPIQERKRNTGAVRELPQLFQSMDWEGEETLSFFLRKIVFQAAQKVIGSQMKLELPSVKIEHPANDNYGDYSTNIALILAGKLKMRPPELAGKIADELNNYIRQYQSRASLTDSLSHQDGKKSVFPAKIDPKAIGEVVETASAANPGFVNLTIRKDYLITLLSELLDLDQSVITTQIKGKKIAVEYTDPNPFKEFHLGHMYSNFIGEAMARIFEAGGATVWRGDFYGDVGMHVAKSVWGMMRKMEEDKISLPELNKLSVGDRQKFLGQGYALGVRRYEEDKVVAEEVKDINYLIYMAGQEILQKEKNWQPIINYRQYILGKEDKLKEIQPIYEAGLRWSLEYFETIYKILNTKFDGYYPESWVGEYGMKIVEKGLKTGVLEKDDGAVVYRGEKDGLHTRVFVNKLGLPTYEAKDLGLAFAKYQDFKYDMSINIFGKEIDEYYYVVKSALIQIEPELGKKAFHLAHGMVKLPEGKMSSRTGNVITFENLLEKLKNEVKKIMKRSDMIGSEKEDVAQVVGLGAVRYALLKSSIGVDVVFDINKSVSFDGDSGPYLQYTYARCKSVLRKSGLESFSPKLLKSLRLLKEMNVEELSLLRTLYRFPEVVAEAARSLSPNLICTFLFDLGQKYNLFYNKHSILNLDNRQQITENKEHDSGKDTSEVAGKREARAMTPPMVEESVRNFRLSLTTACSRIIQQGLKILGIETVERM